MELQEALRLAEGQAKAYSRAAEVIQETIQASQTLVSLQKAMEAAQGELALIQELVKKSEEAHQERLKGLSEEATNAQEAIQVATEAAREGLATALQAQEVAKADFDRKMDEFEALQAAKEEELFAVQSQISVEQRRLAKIKKEIGALKAKLE